MQGIGKRRDKEDIMPNWTRTTIKTDNKEVINVLLNDKKEVDFNKLILMPEGLKDLKAGDEGTAIAYYLTERFSIPYSKTNMKEHLDDLYGDGWKDEIDIKDFKFYVETHKKYLDLDELYELGKKYVENYDSYGAYNWYDWAIDNWGVKWNAVDTEIKDDDMISFFTPWDAPVPIFVELCDMFPDAEITIEADFEDGDFKRWENDNGTLKTLIE